MIARIDVLPDNALELTSKKALPCCDAPDVILDREGVDVVSLSCRACGKKVVTVAKEPPLRSMNPLKRRQALLKAMAKAVDRLVERWNYLVITGLQMGDD